MIVSDNSNDSSTDDDNRNNNNNVYNDANNGFKRYSSRGEFTKKIKNLELHLLLSLYTALVD